MKEKYGIRDEMANTHDLQTLALLAPKETYLTYPNLKWYILEWERVTRSMTLSLNVVCLFRYWVGGCDTYMNLDYVLRQVLENGFLLSLLLSYLNDFISISSTDQSI